MWERHYKSPVKRILGSRGSTNPRLVGSTLTLRTMIDGGRLLVRLFVRPRLPKTSLVGIPYEPHLCVHEDCVTGQGQQDLIWLIAQ